MSNDVSIKEIGRDLWGNKPLLIAVLAGVGIVAYILIKNSNQAASVASAPTSASTLPTGAGATYVEESYNNYQNIVTTTTNSGGQPIIVLPHNPIPVPGQPTPPPPVSTTVVGRTRKYGTNPAYDFPGNKAKGLPLSDAVGHNTGYVPFDTAITLASRQVYTVGGQANGAYMLPDGRYIGLVDVASIG